MPESGEWFSPRTRPEMLTSDDPPVPADKPELVQILPGPGTVAGRAVAPLRRLVAFVPAIGRRIVRVDDEPSRWQLAGMWATGSAIVAATGLAVAAVLGGAPPALTQPFERLAVLPGISDSHEDQKTVTSADEARGDGHSAPARQRTSAGDPRSGGSGSFSSGRDVVTYPEDLVPGRPLPGTSGGSSASGSGSGSGTVSGSGSGSGTVSGGGSTPTGGGSGSTAPPPPAGGGGATTPPETSPTTPPASEPTQEPPTEPSTPTENPTDPAPTQDPTDPAPTPDNPTPPDNSPTDEPAQPTTDPPVADTPAEPAPPTDPAPTTP